VKIGRQLMQTHLLENFALGITDFALGLDLTRGGSLLQFAAAGNVNEYAAYVQDAITIGHLTLNPGLRIDRYDGVGRIKDTQGEPRVGFSYLIGFSQTVLHVGYARTMETPYNENLLVATSENASALVAAFSQEGQAPLKPGHRNQYNIGLQQALSRFVQLEADYFWKRTDNAYDFGVLFNAPIAFPITWPKSKLDGFSLRLSSTNIHGLQWYTTMGHNRARSSRKTEASSGSTMTRIFSKRRMSGTSGRRMGHGPL
jgi:outer membrane receptor protein involved in Fe transport